MSQSHDIVERIYKLIVTTQMLYEKNCEEWSGENQG